eukprot:Rhum_TRINITY_DN14618_c12_g2::Rhum_TRINITY_DN14618_c12_g2_i1::g.105989::m.105989
MSLRVFVSQSRKRSTWWITCSDTSKAHSDASAPPRLCPVTYTRRFGTRITFAAIDWPSEPSRTIMRIRCFTTDPRRLLFQMSRKPECTDTAPPNFRISRSRPACFSAEKGSRCGVRLVAQARRSLRTFARFTVPRNDIVISASEQTTHAWLLPPATTGISTGSPSRSQSITYRDFIFPFISLSSFTCRSVSNPLPSSSSRTRILLFRSRGRTLGCFGCAPNECTDPACELAFLRSRPRSCCRRCRRRDDLCRSSSPPGSSGGGVAAVDADGAGDAIGDGMPPPSSGTAGVHGVRGVVAAVTSGVATVVGPDTSMSSSSENDGRPAAGSVASCAGSVGEHIIGAMSRLHSEESSVSLATRDGCRRNQAFRRWFWFVASPVSRTGARRLLPPPPPP